MFKRILTTVICVLTYFSANAFVIRSGQCKLIGQNFYDCMVGTEIVLQNEAPYYEYNFIYAGQYTIQIGSFTKFQCIPDGIFYKNVHWDNVGNSFHPVAGCNAYSLKESKK